MNPGEACGLEPWFNGWINILFPFINNKKNKFMVPYCPTNDYVREGISQDKYN